MSRVVLLTGATGFLGGELVRRLRARGDEVHALVRPTARRDTLANVEVAWHIGELGDRASLERFFAAGSARAESAALPLHVIHGAALISYARRDRDAARAINVEGTRNVLEAALRRRVERVLHVSSVVTVGSARDGAPIDEAARFDLGELGVDYVDTKRAAEELALTYCDRLDLVVANPGAIFGPVERASNTARFLRQVAQNKGPLVAPPGSLGVVGLADTADGCLRVLDHGRRGERYLLVESSWTSLDLFRLAARLCGTRGPFFAFPSVAWPLVVATARAIDRVRPLRLAPPQALVMLGRTLRFDARKAREELGWSPRPFPEVLQATLESLAERGLLHAPI